MIFYFLAKSNSNPSKLIKIKQELSSALKIKADDIHNQNCYLIYFKNKPNQTTLKKIAALTEADFFDYSENLNFDNCVLDIPRFGTQSSFSSKAFDILHLSGFEIEQIELATIWQFNDEQFIKLKANKIVQNQLKNLISDKMTHELIFENKIDLFFKKGEKTSFKQIDILGLGRQELEKFNHSMGLGLSDLDLDYLENAYKQMNKNPTDTELMMFAAVNSEHCRHKIFNGEFVLDGKAQKLSLFDLIKETSKKSPDNLITAYSDNSSIIKGCNVNYFHRSKNGAYEVTQENQALLMKVETHNHPTVISPFAGAATGSGGEIRDEGATGKGGKPLAGLTGFSVSNLHLPEYPQAWEKQAGFSANYPKTMATSLEIMTEGPIGSSCFNNEFGRPNLAGYFRSFEYLDESNNRWGYHKPIMIAGGMGHILSQNFKKQKITPDALVIVLGPPALKIGIGGGSASSGSLDSKKDSDLDFSSVQRDNPEAQRRAQEVINHCIDLKQENPILSIHDVGAGGLSNAIPELIYDNDLGANLDFNQISINDESMNPLEIWCNESQERYVLAIAEQSLPLFENICKKERCSFRVLGKTNNSKKLTLNDKNFNNKPVDLHLDWLFAKPKKLIIKDNLPQTNFKDRHKEIDFENLNLEQTIKNVLSHPTVGSKAFLIHIGDRTVGGKTVQDQMVGAYQIPIADCAVCFDDFENFSGSAMSMGERPQLALIDAGASAKIAATESILNLIGADIDYQTIALSANWMADCSDKENIHPNHNENAKLYQAVKAISEDFCQKLNIPIPVGKDSLSMKMIWKDEADASKSCEVTSPVSLNVSAFAKVNDVRKTITSELKKTDEDTDLIRVSLSNQNLSSSIFLQTHNLIGNCSIDIDAENLKIFMAQLKKAKEQNLCLAYHDISDGGALAACLEMQFTTRNSIEILLNSQNSQDLFTQLFSESPAVLIQTDKKESKNLINLFNSEGLKAELFAKVISKQTCKDEKFSIYNSMNLVYGSTRNELEKTWTQVSYRIKKIRDNPNLANDEFNQINQSQNKLFLKPSFDLSKLGKSPQILSQKPKVAILREQGINGYMEMAYGFYKAGFEAIDVHMSELIAGTRSLQSFDGIAFPGGFSYGDTFGAATGWASSILYNPKLKEQFKTFFNRKNSFGIGFCNGCQVLSKLKTIIPGANHWPSFKHNLSSRLEARIVMAKVLNSPSIFLQDMQNSCIPIVVSHAEGRADFSDNDYQKAKEKNLVSLCYVNYDESLATNYPMNPNGSTQSVAGLTNNDGRFTIMMPHPERTIRSIQLPIIHKQANEFSPWFKLFENAKKFVS